MPVPNITPLPTPPSRGQAPATFVAAADAFFDALENFPGEVNAAAGAIDTAVTDAEAAADAAIAAASASIIGTSTTSVTIGTGSKTFTTQAGKNWVVGAFVTIPSATNPANFMFGQITSYSSTTLEVNVTLVGGSGTFADWSITLSSPRGAAGANGAPGANGNGAWTQIGSTVNTTSGSTVTFSNIPGNYSDLRFEFLGVSPSASSDIQTSLSDNGSNYTGVGTVVLSALAAGSYYGDLFILGYNTGSGSIGNGVKNLTSARELNMAGGTVGGYRLSGAITHVRFSVSTGNFDAGSIRLWGRVAA